MVECINKISFISNRFCSKSKETTIFSMISDIVLGRFKDKVMQYRETGNKSIKMSLGGYSLPTFKGNVCTNDFLDKTHYMGFDIDGDLSAWRKIVEDERVMFAFNSISGKGIWFICKLPEPISDPKEYRYKYKQYLKYFESKFGVKFDANTCDPRRIITASYDPNAHINLESKPLFKVKMKEFKQKPNNVGKVNIDILPQVFSQGIVGYHDWYFLGLGLAPYEKGEDIFIEISRNGDYKDSVGVIKSKFRSIKEGTTSRSDNILFSLMRKYGLLEEYKRRNNEDRKN